MDNNTRNIGSILKVTGTAILCLSAVGLIFGFIIIMAMDLDYYSDSKITLLGSLLGSCIEMAISGALVYAFGELIEDVKEIKNSITSGATQRPLNPSVGNSSAKPSDSPNNLPKL